MAVEVCNTSDQLSWSRWPQCTDVRTYRHTYHQTKLDIEHTSVGLTHAHTLSSCRRSSVNGMRV